MAIEERYTVSPLPPVGKSGLQQLSPSRLRCLLGQFSAIAAVLCGFRYLWWRAGTLSGTGLLGEIFFSAEIVNYAGILITAIALARVGDCRKVPAVVGTQTLDVFVTVCGEPEEMVESTIRAALDIDYPHNTYVLNDGRVGGKEDWERIDQLCSRLHVPFFTRATGDRGKAANLNNALAQTSGDLILTIDADHRATPTAAAETLRWFVEPQVSFVATRQWFGTTKQHDFLNNEEPIFYGFIQRAKDTDGSAFSCGNGSVYRRSALVSIGGFSEWNVVEDLHTSYRLHAAGWTSVYHPEAVTVGTAPVLAAEYARQRLRWAIDSLRILFFDSPLVRRGLRYRQRLHYMHTTSSYLVIAAQAVFVIGPPLYLLGRVSVVMVPSTSAYLSHVLPYLLSITAMLVAYAGVRGAARTAQSAMFAAPVYVTALIFTLVGRRPGGVTAKERAARFSWLLVPQMLAVVCLVAGVCFAGVDHRSGASRIAVLWAGGMAFVLIGPLAAVSEHLGRVRVLRIIGRTFVVALVAAVLIVGLPEPFRNRLVAPADGAYVGITADGLTQGKRSVISWSDAHGGLRPQLVQWFQQWRSGETSFRADWAEAVEAQGATPLITWEPWSKPADDYADPTQTTSRLQRIIDGVDDAYIRSWARGAAAFRQPILLRFMQELNGFWYPWSVGVNGNTAAQSVAAWRHVHDIFVAEGATNVSWVWSVMPTDQQSLLAAFPGREYVDWIGVSALNQNPGAWLTAEEIFGTSSYRFLASLGRPIMVAEIGSVSDGGDQARWVTDAMTYFRQATPEVKAVVWLDFNVNADYDLDPAAGQALAREAQNPWWTSKRIHVRP